MSGWEEREESLIIQDGYELTIMTIILAEWQV